MKSKKNFNHKESLLSKESPYDTVCTFQPSKDKLFQKGSILDTWKKKHDRTFPTLKDVFSARNLDIPKIRVKVKPFVLDVVKKDTIKMTAKTNQNAWIVKVTMLL